MTTSKNAARITRRTLIATPLIGLFVLGAGAGIANAGTVPMDAPTIAMTITNNTDQTMTLMDDSMTSGAFINAPQQSLAPHSSEIVTASAPKEWDGFTVGMSYGVADTNTIASFQANNDDSGAGTDGTNIFGVKANHYKLSSTMDSGYPNANATYTVGPIS